MIRAKGSFATTLPILVLSAYYVGSALNADWTMYDIDSMFVALNHAIPTLNGYSAWTPEGWRLGNPSDPDYESEVARWIERHDLRGVCELAIERRTMRPRP